MRTLTLWMLLSSMLALGSACGGCNDDDTPDPANNGDEPDVGTTNNGLPDAGDPGPGPQPDMGELENFPSGVFIRMTPGRETYPVGIRLLPEIETFDAFGDPAEFEVTVTVEPPEAAMLVEDRYEMLAEGIVRFTACTVENGLDGVPVCGWDEVVVDNGPPDIKLTAPQPGEQLDATNHAMIQVAGVVTDTFGEPVAFVNGVEVALEPDGSFATEVEPRFGVNHIEVAATDGLHSATATRAVDVMWAADYGTVSVPPVDVQQALVLRLGQLFMDDRQRVATQPDGTFVTKDLADVLELVIRNLDLTSQIPDPVVDSTNITLRVPQVATGKPYVQLDVTDTGLEIFIQITDLQATTQGSITIDQQTLTLDGNITGGMSALVVLSVDKPDPASPVEVTVDTVSVAVEQVTPNFLQPEVNAIFALAQSVLRNTIEQLLLDVLEGGFVDQLPTLLTEVLSALDTVLADQTIDLDTGLGTPVQLQLDGGVNAIESSWRHHLDATLGLTAATDVSGVHADSRGYAMMWAMPGAPAFFDQGRIQFGLRFAMVNALLHALWDAGLLEADVTDSVPVNVDRADLSAKLPPVVRPPLLGEPHDFVIELGQVEIETEILGRTDRYGINISTGVDFALQNGALEVTIGSTPQIRTWLISSSEDEPFLSPEALRDLIEGRVWPEFTAALSGGLSLPLPTPDLSGLGAVAAPLANLVLEFKQVLPVAVRDGWIVIDATMEGTLPVNP